MSRHDYHVAQQLDVLDPPFYALVMALYRRADSFNQAKLEHAWPEVCREARERYNAPGGLLPGEPGRAEADAIRADWRSHD